MYYELALNSFYKVVKQHFNIWEVNLLLLIYSRFGDGVFYEREIMDITTRRKLATLLQREIIIKAKKGYIINSIYIDNIKKQNDYIYNRFLTPKYNKFLTDNQ
jgi:hypothetical protein